MKNEKYLLIMVLLATMFGVVSCSDKYPQDVLTAQISTTTPSPTGSSSIGKSPNSTLSVPISTNDISNTPTTTSATPTLHVTSECLIPTILTERPAELGGILVINDEAGGGSYLLDLESGNKQVLTNSHAESVSPNREKLAYIRSNPWQLIIVNGRGEQLAKITAQQAPVNLDQGDRLVQWLDNDRILLEHNRGSSTLSRLSIPSLFIFDPFSGDEREIVPESFPDIYGHRDRGIAWSFLSNLVPDPTITRVVYPEMQEDAFAITLWDLTTQQAMRRIYSYYGQEGVTPVWMPDGSAFIAKAPIRFENYYGTVFDNLPDEKTLGGEELLYIQRDGQIKRLTYMTNNYRVKIGQMAISPDQARIAYRYRIDDQFAKEYLAVLDIKSSEVTSFCLSGRPTSSEFSISSAPVWSPDGKFLAIDVPDVNKPQRNILLLDIKNQSIIEIAEDASIVGWLALR